MKSDRAVPHLNFTRRVTKKSGERFARKWLASGGDDYDALASAALIEFPGERNRAKLDRHNAIEDEIMSRFLRAIEPHVVREFVKVARSVLARERARERKSGSGKP